LDVFHEFFFDLFSFDEFILRMVILFTCFQILRLKIECKVESYSIFIDLGYFTKVDFFVGSHDFDKIICFDTLLSFFCHFSVFYQKELNN
jgi:hypothetical protein